MQGIRLPSSHTPYVIVHVQILDCSDSSFVPKSVTSSLMTNSKLSNGRNRLEHLLSGDRMNILEPSCAY